jgi:raffinose/stachyose/melibiose transport system permease protein
MPTGKRTGPGLTTSELMTPGRIAATITTYPRWMFWKGRDSDQYMGYLYYLPALILVLVLNGYPLVRGVQVSLTHSVGVATREYVGLENYRMLVQDKIFVGSLLNVLKGVACLPVFVLVPLVLAFLLFQGVRGWRSFRAIYFFSYTLAPVMVGYVFTMVLGADGPVNTFLRDVGLDRIAVAWFGTVETSIWAVYAVVLWSWFGLGTIIYLAGLATVSEEYFDAGKIDGANWFQLMRHIAIPSVMPTMGYWSVVCTTGLLVWLFPYIYALTQGGPGYSSMVPEYYIYMTVTRYLNGGYGSAMGVVLFGLVFLISFFQVRLMYLQSAE